MQLLTVRKALVAYPKSKDLGRNPHRVIKPFPKENILELV